MALNLLLLAEIIFLEKENPAHICLNHSPLCVKITSQYLHQHL